MWKQRFWSRVDTNAGEDGCWPWLGCLDTSGYGSFRYDSVLRGAHRVAYELVRETIPPAVTVDHLCRNKRCCNPRHMELVSRSENIRRSWAAGGHNRQRKSHCKNGHPLRGPGAVLYYRKDRNRHDCLICRRMASRSYVAYDG